MNNLKRYGLITKSFGGSVYIYNSRKDECSWLKMRDILRWEKCEPVREYLYRFSNENFKQFNKKLHDLDQLLFDFRKNCFKAYEYRGFTIQPCGRPESWQRNDVDTYIELGIKGIRRKVFDRVFKESFSGDPTKVKRTYEGSGCTLYRWEISGHKVKVENRVTGEECNTTLLKIYKEFTEGVSQLSFYNYKEELV
jgi:hypothetical protein